MKIRALCVVGVFACGQANAVVVPSDAVFNSSFEPGIRLQGKAGYPGPLANATVELHLGNYVATTAAKADGTYSLLVETQFLTPVTIAELIAFGHGADVAKVWASPLGPSDRLPTLGSGGVVTFADEPFLNLNPRTTALAGALRAYNNFAPIGDKATFYKAARSYQTYTENLTFGLALVARGDQALPTGAANTFEAVASLSTTQQLFNDETTLASVDCASTPTAPYCGVQATLTTDPSIVPLHPWIDGRIYSGVTGFDYGLRQQSGVRPHGTTADLIGLAATPLLANIGTASDGSYAITLPGNTPIATSDTFPVINGHQVHQHDEVLAIHLRVTLGPGGQAETQGSAQHTYTYPENPEIQPQPVVVQSAWSLPNYAGSEPLPPELVALVPDVSNRRFVLGSPFQVPDPQNGYTAPYGYDVYDFATHQTERQAKSLTYSGAGTASLALDFAADSMHADVQFINEESPGIWRVRMHATQTSPASEQLFDGLMMETIGAAGGFTSVNLPGSYVTVLNGDSCGGPYAFDPNSCGPPPFGWIFNGSGSATHLDGSQTWTWQLPSGADSGRLLFARPSFVATPIMQMRGWELVRSDGVHDMWVLENVTTQGATSAPPVAFIPTARLAHVTKL